MIGLAAGQRERADCEHLLARAAEVCGAAGARVELACTHVVDGRWALSLQVDGAVPTDLAEQVGAAVHGDGLAAGPGEWSGHARAAAEQLRTGSAGRAVLFGGQPGLVGDIPVQEVTARSAITRVRGIAGIPVTDQTLHTQDFLRPLLEDGELVLVVRYWDDAGDLAPFEVPNPVACCAVHG